MTKAKHPMQPLYVDRHGTVRFKRNYIVEKILAVSQANGYGLNELACGSFSQEDFVQFAQLIGYSLCGFHELSYVPDEVAIAASDKTLEDIGERFGGCRDNGCEIHCGVNEEDNDDES